MTKTVVVTMYVPVTVDETKFDEAFLSEFRDQFYDFDGVDDHLRHLAQLSAREIIGYGPDEFIEGYGVAKDMGISFGRTEMETEIQ